MGERPPNDPLRFGNTTVNVGSSTGWTDEKHMRYITSLEESFVNQLYNGELATKGLVCRYPEGYCGVLETNGAASRSSQIEYLGSFSCSGFQENSIACYMDYDMSTNCPQQGRTSNPARSESSGQNFVDGEVEVIGEHDRECREKQWKQKPRSASSSRKGQGPMR